MVLFDKLNYMAADRVADMAHRDPMIKARLL